MSGPVQALRAGKADRAAGAAGDGATSSLPEPGFVPVPIVGIAPGGRRALRRSTGAMADGSVLRRSVIRRMLDKDGKKVTLDRIKESKDVAELTYWLTEQTDWEEAPSTDETDAIKARIAALQPAASAKPEVSSKTGSVTKEATEDPVAKAKAEADRKAREYQQQFEALAGKPLANFDGATAKQLFEGLGVPKRDVAGFFLRCTDLTLVPATVQAEFAGITPETHPQLWGVLSFVDGTSLANAKLVTALDLSCLRDVTAGFDIDGLIGLIDGRVLTISKNTYRITKGTGANGAVYRFELPGRKQLGPIGAEWHVHFGVRDAAENPGFKHKTRGDESFRVPTSAANCQKLKKCFGPLWGVKV